MFFYDFEAIQNIKKSCNIGYEAINKNGCNEKGCTKEDLCSKCFKCRYCANTSCGRFFHKPNLVVAHTICNNCNKNDKTCNSCGKICDINHISCNECTFSKEIIFKGNNCVENFFNYFINNRYKNFIFIAHNMRGMIVIFY